MTWQARTVTPAAQWDVPVPWSHLVGTVPSCHQLHKPLHELPPQAPLKCAKDICSRSDNVAMFASSPSSGTGTNHAG